jgi:hypothetical protein
MSPLLVTPTLGPDGSLRWHVRSGEAIATFDVTSGTIYRNKAALNSKDTFETVLGALIEYYRTDAEEFNGLNVEKVRAELENDW